MSTGRVTRSRARASSVAPATALPSRSRAAAPSPALSSRSRAAAPSPALSSRSRAAAPAPAASKRATRASSRRREVSQESSDEDDSNAETSAEEDDSDTEAPLFDYFPEDVADWRKNFRYLLNLTKTLAHARGLVFVPVSKTLLHMLSKSPHSKNADQDDALVRKHVKATKSKYTPEFVAYAVEINRIIRDDIIKGHMCEVLIKKRTGRTPPVWDAPMGPAYINSSFGRDKDYFPKTSMVLALQLIDNGSHPTARCVAALTYRTVDNFDKEKYQTFNGERYDDYIQLVKAYPLGENPEPKNYNLQYLMDEGHMLDIALLCARGPDDEAGIRAHRKTAALMTIYTIAKELMRVKTTRTTGTLPLYESVFMDCAGYKKPGQQAYSFDAENIAKELGFCRWKVQFPKYPAVTTPAMKRDPDFQNCNDQYNFKTGENRVYILSDEGKGLYTKLLIYLNKHFANSEMLRTVCPMTPGTKVPACA